MNNNIIPYVPIAERVQATSVKSALLCQQFFQMIDKIINSQLVFNHDTSKGSLCINPEQLNDLIRESNQQTKVDIGIFEEHFSRLIYPRFIGVKEMNSPIWNNESVKVWHFQLDQVEEFVDGAIISIDPAREHTLGLANDCVDEAMGMLRVWRASLETGTDNLQLEYRANDVATLLLQIEQKLNKAKGMMWTRQDGVH